jgi:hypothetical protein
MRATQRRGLIERSVEVRHGMALRQSQQEVEALKAQLEDDEYAQRLETEGVSLRAKKQRMKDKEAVNGYPEKVLCTQYPSTRCSALFFSRSIGKSI